MASLNDKIREAHDVAARVAEKNNIMIARLDETYQDVIESTNALSDLDTAVADLARNKVDKAPYN